MTTAWLRRHRKIMAWAAGAVALMLVAFCVTGYAMVRHLNDNIKQIDLDSLIGPQPANPHPGSENILIIGSDYVASLDGQYGAGQTAAEADTLMLVHIQADKKWAEVMSIPAESEVSIPACAEGGGQLSAPTESQIGNAFETGNLNGNDMARGAACTIKTVEQATGIDINHFIVVNYTGFTSMVDALGGVRECNPTAFTNPGSGIVLSAGRHWLDGPQALAYVRAISGIGNGTDLERVARQQAFVAAMIGRVKGELYNPLATYRFLDAFTSSLTVDSQLGGITGLYHLEQTLHGIPSSKIALFTLPASGTTNLALKQPEDSQIFASLRNDVPASSSLFTAQATATAAISRPGKFGVTSYTVTIPSRTVGQGICAG